MKNRNLLLSLILVCLSGLISITVSAQETIIIEILFQENEITDEEIAIYEQANPNIDIVRSSLVFGAYSALDLELAIADGVAPDIMRASSETLGGMIERGIVLDITEFVRQSDIIDEENLSEIIDYYIFEGRYYGLPKDWSPPQTIFINVSMFEEAGLAIPEASEPLSYSDLRDMAEALTMYDETGEVTRHGLTIRSLLREIERILIVNDQRLFAEDYSSIEIMNNELAREVIRYFYDMQIAGYLGSTLSSLQTNNWALLSGDTAMTIEGYWFGASFTEEIEIADDQVILLPPAIWGSTSRRNVLLPPTGFVISADTEHPQEVYAFLEYMAFGEPALSRTSRGWGLPLDNTLQTYLPVNTEFSQQIVSTALNEMAYEPLFLEPYPFVNLIQEFNQSWNRNLREASNGNIDFEQFLLRLESEITLLLINGE